MIDLQIPGTPSKQSLWLFSGFLFVVGVAEASIALVSTELGLLLHSLVLVALTLYVGLGWQDGERRFVLTLTIIPLLRMLSLALPLASLPQLAWYPLVSAPLLVSALLVIRQLRMSRSELGLHPGNILIQLMLMGGGLGIGAAEYALLGGSQLVVAFSWNALTLLAVLLLLFTGFVEELIFRGLLQAAALPAVGRWALVYVSLLFAALHIGYLSAPVVAFAFGVGLVFACAVRWGGSIMGVALAHGLANITLFILMPFLAQQAASPAAVAIRSVIAAGSVLAVSALAFLFGRAIWQRRAALPIPSVAPINRWLPQLVARPTARANHAANLVPAVPMIRALRRAAGITYSDLGQRTQLPARLLAEIEHGMRLPTPEQLGIIFQMLGVDMQQLAATAA